MGQIVLSCWLHSVRGMNNVHHITVHEQDRTGHNRTEQNILFLLKHIQRIRNTNTYGYEEGITH